MQKMNGWRKLLYTLAAGSLCFFLSEAFYWARWRTDSTPILAFGTWLMYCFVTYTTLIIIDRYQVKNFWGFFLSGAIYGWLVEGVLVGKVYEFFPMGISFTALGWHALLSVSIGLYILPRFLKNEKFSKIVLVAVITGLIYTFWAFWWWREDSTNINHPVPWLLYTGAISLFSILAIFFVDRLSFRKRFTSSQGEWIGVLVAWSILFVIARYFSFWWGLIVLPALLALTIFGLHKGQNKNNPVQGKDQGDKRKLIPFWNLFALLALPVSSSIFYILAYFFGLTPPTNVLFLTIIIPAGFVLYIIAWVKNFQRTGTIKAENETHLQGD